MTEELEATEEGVSQNMVGYIVEKSHGSCVARCNQEEVMFSRQVMTQGRKECYRTSLR